jgi:hypothetical protein
MTNSVTFPVNLGGDGSTVTDDDNATTGLGNGGHRTRFVPAMGQVVAVANTLTQRLSTQYDTSATSLLIGTGSKSFTTAGFYEWAVGMYVLAASAANPTNLMYGQVTSWTTATNVLVVNVLAVGGSGTFADWTVSLAGPPNLSTLPAIISVTSTSAALRVTQLGTGDALVVEDSANPDTSPFVVDASGNVGIGTSSPTVAIDVSRTGTNPSILLTRTDASIAGSTKLEEGNGGTFFYQSGAKSIIFGTSNTERLRLDSSGNLGLGVTPSGWSSITALELANGTALGSYSGGAIPNLYLGTNCFYDGSWKYKVSGSYRATRYLQSSGGEHQWYNSAAGTAGNAISFTQAMSLDASGNLLVGGTSLIAGSEKVAVKFSSNTGPGLILSDSTIQAGTTFAGFYSNTTKIGSITAATTTTVAYNTSSDQRLKTNVEPAGSAIESILNFPVDQFDWIASGEHQDFGAVAQKVQPIIPEMVSVPADEDEMWGIDWSKAVPRLIRTIQELSAQVTTLQAEINALKA